MSGSELKADARKLMMENAPKIFIICIIYLIISTVISELEFRLPGTSDAYSQFLQQISAGEPLSTGLLCSDLKPPGVALAALLWLIRPVIEVGYMSYCLKMKRKLGGNYKDILDGFLFFAKIILISIITTVLTLLWSILLIFPGIIASYRYRQAFYILLDSPEKGVLQCIRESKTLMAGKKLDLFLLDLSFLGWMLLDYIVMLVIPAPFSFPIISIYLAPYRGLTCAAYYDQLLNRLVV